MMPVLSPALLGLLSGALAQPPAWCAPRDTSLLGRTTDVVMLDAVRRLASTRDSSYGALRDSLARMPYVPPEQVVRITDERVCERASRALATQLFTPDSLGAPHLESVIVFRAGPRLIAVPHATRMGEFGYAVHLDSTTFRKLAVTSF